MDRWLGRQTYINEQIKAPNIMIVDDEKNNLGTFPRRVALEMATERGLDLVQMVYDPEKMLSTVRLTDYGKYMYQKWKDERERRKKQKTNEMKELRLSYGIGDNDLNFKLKKAIEFLESGYNVKISIRLRGRERIYEDRARERLEFVQQELSDYGKSQFSTPKKEANGYSVILLSK